MAVQSRLGDYYSKWARGRHKQKLPHGPDPAVCVPGHAKWEPVTVKSDRTTDVRGLIRE
jgi:hypothetical protein